MQFTLAELWTHMGLFARIIVVVMLAMSMASMLVAGDRFLTLRQFARESRDFAARLSRHLDEGDLDGAASIPPAECAGPLGRVLGAGLKSYRIGRGDDPATLVESVARALERQTEREVHTMKKGQSTLATVASTAPFVGLLGTVVGIVNSFQSMASTGSGGLGTVSAGVAEALVTTALGLLVAIPAVIVSNAVQTFIEARTVDLSEASNELLDAVARQANLARARHANPPLASVRPSAPAPLS